MTDRRDHDITGLLSDDGDPCSDVGLDLTFDQCQDPGPVVDIDVGKDERRAPMVDCEVHGRRCPHHSVGAEMIRVDRRRAPPASPVGRGGDMTAGGTANPDDSPAIHRRSWVGA